MAKDKDRTLNPAAQQRKLEKQKAVKKGKAAVTAQRNERLATRNPTRLESQITALHELRDSSGGKLKPREQKQLEDLEKDVARIKKAREAVGAPPIVKREYNNDDGKGRGWNDNRGARPPKRRRDSADRGSDSETTDEEVRRIPWPRDTPPPIPRQQQPRRVDDRPRTDAGSEVKPDTTLPTKPAAPIRTTYESKAQVRDLQKEATNKFMPSVVKRKIDAVKGRGGLIDEEELDRLEKEGYRLPSKGESASGDGAGVEERKHREEVAGTTKQPDLDEETLLRLKAEEEAFEREIAEAEAGEENAMEDVQADEKKLQPTVEEASDEDG